MADRIGLKKIFMLGIFLFALTYAGFAMANRVWMVYALSLLL